MCFCFQTNRVVTFNMFMPEGIKFFPYLVLAVLALNPSNISTDDGLRKIGMMYLLPSTVKPLLFSSLFPATSFLSLLP
jgi:hypothetical protein